jgi:tRNA modification GTPase
MRTPALGRKIATTPASVHHWSVHSHPHSGPRELSANETIAAVSTPPGRGGIGIVRLSGPEALAIATPILRLRSPLAPGQARFAEILDHSTEDSPVVLDQAVVTYFAQPHSYTAEDLVEIAAHGSPVVLDAILRQVIHRGARLAEPGEFTQRAFLSGRLDLTQAEAVRDLIEAQTLYQARVAALQMGGSLSRRVQPIKQLLVELIALLEAGIDFAEDDVDVAPDTEILRRIALVRDPLDPIAASFAHGRIVRSGLTLAIVGRPNVGKSSLFNRVVERERAIVTATPGTTRDLVTERVAIGGIPIELVDTAGLRQALDEAESIGIRKSREALAEADIVLVVLDATHPLGDDEAELLASLTARRAIAVRNKSDLVADPATLIEQWSAIDGLSLVVTSATTGAGISELREEILRLARGTSGEEQTGMLTNLRQHQAVTAALESLAAAQAAVARRTPHEMLLLDLYSALRNLDNLTGETTPDDILNLIFSTFCIGK